MTQNLELLITAQFSNIKDLGGTADLDDALIAIK